MKKGSEREGEFKNIKNKEYKKRETESEGQIK
jgi:hypothetical protein